MNKPPSICYSKRSTSLKVTVLASLLATSNLVAGTPAVTPESVPPPVPIFTANLPGNFAYWRLASYTPKTNWADLSAQLDEWEQHGAEGLVLDLRSNLAPDDYAGAAQIAAFFTSDKSIPFKLSDAAFNSKLTLSFRPAQPFHQPILVIVNHQTSGAAEALADVLKHKGALVIGQATSGTAASVTLPDGIDLGQYPVQPDIALKINESTEKSALDLIAQGQISDVIGEIAERHRMCEAALVQGEDPEQDAYLESRENKHVLLSLPTVHDVALICALDSLKAIRLSQKQAAPAATAEAQAANAGSPQ